MTSPARSTHPKAALRLSALLPALLLSACFQAPAPAPVPAAHQRHRPPARQQ
jgi:hypothetical protein